MTQTTDILAVARKALELDAKHPWEPKDYLDYRTALPALAQAVIDLSDSDEGLHRARAAINAQSEDICIDIERMKEKLAIAVDALKQIALDYGGRDQNSKEARAALAKIEGETTRGDEPDDGSYVPTVAEVFGFEPDSGGGGKL